MIDLALSPRTLHPDDCIGKLVVVIDVLRATTTMATMLAHGARRVVPVSSLSAAHRAAAAYATPGEPEPIVAGERNGAKLKGCARGNSPLEYPEAEVRGRTLVFTSTNGTQAILCARKARAIFLGALVNVGPTVDAVLRLLTSAETIVSDPGKPDRTSEPDVLLLCSGRKGGRAVSLEDTVCGGALAWHLAQRRPKSALSDGAEMARQLYELHRDNLDALVRQSQSGRHLAKIGYGDDLGICAREGSLPVVCQASLVVQPHPAKLEITRVE